MGSDPLRARHRRRLCLSRRELGPSLPELSQPSVRLAQLGHEGTDVWRVRHSRREAVHPRGLPGDLRVQVDRR